MRGVTNLPSEKPIQGLYEKPDDKAFWLLLAKVSLAKFLESRVKNMQGKSERVE